MYLSLKAKPLRNSSKYSNNEIRSQTDVSMLVTTCIIIVTMNLKTGAVII